MLCLIVTESVHHAVVLQQAVANQAMLLVYSQPCPYLTHTLCMVQGHALMTRHSGSANPCPVIDFDAGFNAWMAYAYGLPKGTTVEQKFGKPFGMLQACHALMLSFVCY